VRGAGVTVNVALPLTAPLVADTVALPTLAAVARPVLLNVATASSDESQVASAVRSCVEASE